MSIAHMLDGITAWVQENICNGVDMKVPPEDDLAPVDEGYKYQRTTPTAFPLFVPARDKRPPAVLSPFPSVCVRFLDGEERIDVRKGSAEIQLCFSTWSPGTHKADVIGAKKNEKAFSRNMDGWRDAWNMVDIALREIGSSLNVGGYELDRSVPVKYGPMTEQGDIVEAYPLWFAWVSFSIHYHLLRNVEEIENEL